MADHPLAHRFHADIWASLGGDPAWSQRVEVVGSGAIRSAFGCSDIAAAAFAACGTAVAELLEAGGSAPGGVRVDRAVASEWFRMPPVGPSRPLDPPPGFARPVAAGDDREAVLSAISPGTVFSNVYPAADGRWVFLRGGGRQVLDALGVPEDYDQVAARIAASNADEIEKIIIDAGGTGAANHSIAEWLDHPQGRAVNSEPIIDVRTTTTFPAERWRPTAGRPLAGIRVLDLTRVLAGPLCTRFLAACGAEVLRLDAPDSEESRLNRTVDFADTMQGKRWAFLDLRTPKGREVFFGLLQKADVLVHGYRPGAIDGLVDPALRAEARPGLVEVTLNAYGWTGEWASRRGYDSTTQFTTGLCNETTAWALEDPDRRLPLNAIGRLVDASRPRHLPIEVLDFATAYQAAAAAVRGLTRRLQTGEGSLSRLSLARTAALIISGGRAPEEDALPIPLDGPFEPRVYTNAGTGAPERRLAWPLTIDGNPLFWERAGDRVGSSTPTWATV